LLVALFVRLCGCLFVLVFVFLLTIFCDLCIIMTVFDWSLYSYLKWAFWDAQSMRWKLHDCLLFYLL
jgi:hypothetical protein